MDYSHFHERKDVWLYSSKKPCSQLWRLLNEKGFKRKDEIYSFDRPKNENIEIWESDTIVGVDVFNDDKAVYYGDRSWTKINFYYLLATLPRNYIHTFCRIVESVSESLELPIYYDEQIISFQELENKLQTCADESANTIGEPGSKTAAMLIEMSYPRR